MFVVKYVNNPKHVNWTLSTFVIKYVNKTRYVNVNKNVNVTKYLYHEVS